MTTREKHSGSSEVILQSTNVTTQSSDFRLRSSSTGGRHLISLLLGLSFLFSQSLNASNSGDLAGAERLPDEAGPAKESRADEKKTGHGGATCRFGDWIRRRRNLVNFATLRSSLIDLRRRSLR